MFHGIMGKVYGMGVKLRSEYTTPPIQRDKSVFFFIPALDLDLQEMHEVSFLLYTGTGICTSSNNNNSMF
jgi:hypothetical protein